MLKVGKLQNLAEANKANLLYKRGDEAWSKGQLRSAFRFFRAAAKAGMAPAFSVVGQFYDRGDGVRPDADAALYWYRLAYRSGARSVANNIGCILRDRNHVRQAIKWFRRAVRQNDGNANLNIAKIYLRKGDPAGALSYLNKTCRSAWATEGAKEEARRLLKATKKKGTSGLHGPRKTGSVRVAVG